MPIPALLWTVLALGQAPVPSPTDSRAVTIELLDGTSIPGESLKKLTGDSVEVEAGGEAKSFATRDLQAVRWTAANNGPPENAAAIEIRLQDGSVLHASEFTIRQRMAQITTPLGVVTLPGTELRSVRVAPNDEKIAAAWAEMAARDTRNDLLVVRKGDALEFFGGVIGESGKDGVRLLVKEREITVPPARVFGLVFVRQPDSKEPLSGEVQTTSGDRLMSRQLSLADGKLSVQLAGKARVSIPLEQLAAIDFTLGKVKALADLPMDQEQFAKSVILTPSIFEVRKNQTALGEPLRIGDRDYTRGLWIHSGVAAKFRLGREYRKLTAVMGLDSNSPRRAKVAAEVTVAILGDGKSLFEERVAWNDAPRQLDLDVSGVRDLEIRVTPAGESPGALEHLDLAEARVIQ